MNEIEVDSNLRTGYGLRGLYENVKECENVITIKTKS